MTVIQLKPAFVKKRVRIEGIDTPEKGQTGYSEAKKALNQLLKDEKVTVTPVATDVYGRTVAKVKIGNRLVSTLMKKHQKNNLGIEKNLLNFWMQLLVLPDQTLGGMFWFNRKMFCGSYLFFSTTRRS